MLVFPAEAGQRHGRRVERAGRRGRRAAHRRPAEAVLRRLARRGQLVGPPQAAGGASPGARALRVVDPVARSLPFIADDCGGGPVELATTGCSMGATHALNITLRHAETFVLALCFSGNYDPASMRGWGERGMSTYFTNPADYVPNLSGEHLDWLRSRVSVLLVCGQGQWEDTTGALESTRWMAGQLADKGIRLRAGPVGVRRAARLAVLARAVGAPLAAVLLTRQGRGDRVMTDDHIVGLLLGTEEDWPAAFTEIMRRTGPITDGAGRSAHLRRQAGHHRAVRPAGPAAALAGHRPAGVLVLPPARVAEEGRADGRRVPAQQPVHLPVHGEARRLLRDDAARAEGARHRAGAAPSTRWTTPATPTPRPATTSRSTWTRSPSGIGYPMFMKPYDGGAWVGVSRVRNGEELHRAYDESGERLMHLQSSVEGYDAFARSLSIGAETMVMRFRPELPMHDRYAVQHDVPLPGGREPRSPRSPSWSTRSSGGSSTPARCWCAAPRCTPSTTPTPARTWR